MSATRAEKKSKPKEQPTDKQQSEYPEPADNVKDDVVYPAPAQYAQYEALEYLHHPKAKKVTERTHSDEEEAGK